MLTLPADIQPVLIQSEEQCKVYAQKILIEVSSSTDTCTIWSVDAEWRVTFKKGEVRPVALLQFCKGRTVYLFHIHHCGIPEELRQVLLHPRILKVGVNIKNDALKLERDFVELRRSEQQCKQSVQLGCTGVAGIVDLRELAEALGVPAPTNKKSLAAMIEVYCGHELEKTKSIRLGNWEKKELEDVKIHYASLDAFAGCELLNAICAKSGAITESMDFEGVFRMSPVTPLLEAMLSLAAQFSPSAFAAFPQFLDPVGLAKATMAAVPPESSRPSHSADVKSDYGPYQAIPKQRATGNLNATLNAYAPVLAPTSTVSPSTPDDPTERVNYFDEGRQTAAKRGRPYTTTSRAPQRNKECDSAPPVYTFFTPETVRENLKSIDKLGEFLDSLNRAQCMMPPATFPTPAFGFSASSFARPSLSARAASLRSAKKELWHPQPSGDGSASTSHTPPASLARQSRPNSSMPTADSLSGGSSAPFVSPDQQTCTPQQPQQQQQPSLPSMAVPAMQPQYFPLESGARVAFVSPPPVLASTTYTTTTPASGAGAFPSNCDPQNTAAASAILHAQSPSIPQQMELNAGLSAVALEARIRRLPPRCAKIYRYLCAASDQRAAQSAAPGGEARGQGSAICDIGVREYAKRHNVKEALVAGYMLSALRTGIPFPFDVFAVSNRVRDAVVFCLLSLPSLQTLGTPPSLSFPLRSSSSLSSEKENAMPTSSNIHCFSAAVSAGSTGNNGYVSGSCSSAKRPLDRENMPDSSRGAAGTPQPQQWKAAAEAARQLIELRNASSSAYLSSPHEKPSSAAAAAAAASCLEGWEVFALVATLRCCLGEDWRSVVRSQTGCSFAL